MKSVVMRDLRDYVRKYWGLLAASMAAMLICFGYLVFCGNIRIDTEELINHPGSSLGWLAIGRWELAWLKHLLGLGTHQVIKSGILFFLFFWLGANLLTFGIYERSGKKKSRYWIFLLLYVTSNIWCYQIYFSLQQAEVALAMLLLIEAAFLMSGIGTGTVTNLLRAFAACVLLFIGLGSYQALAVYYIAVCLVFFLAELTAEREQGGYLQQILWMIVHFGVVYLCYHWYMSTFLVSSDYMDSQMGWGRLPALACIKNVLRTLKNLLLGHGPRNFSFYGCGVVLLLVLAGKRACLPEKTGTSVGEEENPVFIAWTGGTGACAAASDGIHGRDDRDEITVCASGGGSVPGNVCDGAACGTLERQRPRYGLLAAARLQIVHLPCDCGPGELRSASYRDR